MTATIDHNAPSTGEAKPACNPVWLPLPRATRDQHLMVLCDPFGSSLVITIGGSDRLATCTLAAASTAVVALTMGSGLLGAAAMAAATVLLAAAVDLTDDNDLITLAAAAAATCAAEADTSPNDPTGQRTPTGSEPQP